MTSADAAENNGLHTVRAEIGYLRNIPLYDQEKPFSAAVDFQKHIPGARNSNILSERHEMDIEDVRGREMQLTFENDGCRIVRHSTLVPNLLDFHTIESLYLKECEELVKREMNADFVYIFNWLIRKKERAPNDPRDIVDRVARMAHKDNTQTSAYARLNKHLPSKAAELRETMRYQIINIWRPINDVIEDCPLAFCHPQSTNESDEVAGDVVKVDYIGEVYYMKYRTESKHRWFYLSRQTQEEVWLFKSFDSHPAEGEARALFHCAFNDPEKTSDSRPRISIEVRAMVFHKIAQPEVKS
ncbi:hypothetical protein AA313_de0203575 [Arthrobotrys entomopaga]|nr:hypothetical protein AA313_de0203575 [Arthrobotrys entomopaga]